VFTRSRLVALAVVVLVAFALTPPGRSAVMAALLLPHFFPGGVPRPLRLFTPAPSVQTVEVPGAPGRMVADLYLPVGAGRHPAMVLLLGVNPLPRDHEQVTTLADGIARAGIATVVAESDALLGGEIRPEEVDNLVALFEYLERHQAIDPQRIGFSGFCVGAVLELLAASDPRIADRVAYVNAFSVYADPIDVLKAILTRSMPVPEGRAPWTPSDLTREIFIKEAIATLPAQRDRALLARELIEGTTLTAQEIESLSSGATHLRELLTTRDPERVETLSAALPADIVTALRRLSPAATVPRLRATTFLMHDQNDTYLPVSGARQLAALLPRETSGRYSEFRLFAHVVPGGIEDPVLFAGEMVKLLDHIRAVIQAAYAGRPGR
jgi:pimeloyl-ACP methyl ester carboxylesterase